MTNIDELIVESIANNDNLATFEARVESYDATIREPEALLLANRYSELARINENDAIDRIGGLLDENVDGLENAQRIGLDNKSEIRVSQEMIQRYGDDLDRVERKIDEMGVGITYDEGWGRRDYLIAGGSVAGVGILAAIADAFNLAPGDSDCGGGIRLADRDEPGANIDGFGTLAEQERCDTETRTYQSISGVVDDFNAVENYMGDLHRNERGEWSTLINTINEGTFDTGDLDFDSLEVRYRENPDIDSEYIFKTEIGDTGRIDPTEKRLSDDAAENALQYFEELDVIEYKGE